MRIVRQLSTRRLLAAAGAVVAAAVAASVASVTAFGSRTQAPPAQPLDRALEQALSAPQPAGITARVKLVNNLFPSGALAGVPGAASSALLAGGSGRLWWSPGHGGRIELQSDAGDAQILWDATHLTIWDSSSNTVYTLPLPAQAQGAKEQPPTLADIDAFLQRLAQRADVAGPVPTTVAGEPAYRVTVSPAHSAGLIGSLVLAWDADHGVPLEVAIHAQGQSAPALALTVTDIAFGAVPASDLAIAPPTRARRVTLGGTSGGHYRSGGEGVTGLQAVRAAVPFKLVAPARLVGLPRQSVQLLGGRDRGALVLYGRGLGAIALVEHAAGASPRGPAGALPAVALGRATGHELATALGTVLFFDRDGVGFVLAGSVPPTAAEAAARSLR